MAVQNALLVDWDVESSLQTILDEFLVEPITRPMYGDTGEDVFLNPASAYHPNQPKRTKKIQKTKLPSEVERFDPFHAMHYYA